MGGKCNFEHIVSNLILYPKRVDYCRVNCIQGSRNINGWEGELKLRGQQWHHKSVKWGEVVGLVPFHVSKLTKAKWKISLLNERGINFVSWTHLEKYLPALAMSCWCHHSNHRNTFWVWAEWLALFISFMLFPQWHLECKRRERQWCHIT